MRCQAPATPLPPEGPREGAGHTLHFGPEGPGPGCLSAPPWLRRELPCEGEGVGRGVLEGAVGDKPPSSEGPHWA